MTRCELFMHEVMLVDPDPHGEIRIRIQEVKNAETYYLDIVKIQLHKNR